MSRRTRRGVATRGRAARGMARPFVQTGKGRNTTLVALRNASTLVQSDRVSLPVRLFARRSNVMTIKVGDRLPEGTLSEFIEVEGNGCSVGPNQFKVEDLTKGKKVVIFGLPGAFTPTCSAKHVPSYLANFDKLKAKGVDAVYCMSVNDPFVMGAWGRDQKAGDKVHMMADGSADYTKKLGLDLDLNARGMGTRCQRFSMLVEDGVVKALNVEAPGKYEVSGAETMLTQLG